MKQLSCCTETTHVRPGVFEVMVLIRAGAQRAEKRGTCRVKQSECKLSEPVLLGPIGSPMPIGTDWIPFLSSFAYNRFADLLAIRVSLDEEGLVAVLHNYDTDRILRHS